MSDLIPITFTKLHPDAKLPVYSTEHAVGMDAFALVHYCGTTGFRIEPGETVTVETGISVDLPPNFELQVRPRSGMAANHGITILNTPGTIDPDYRGEIQIILHNTSEHPFRVKHGDRIAQLVLAPVYRAIINGNAPSGARRTGGFGSTGI